MSGEASYAAWLVDGQRGEMERMTAAVRPGVGTICSFNPTTTKEIRPPSVQIAKRSHFTPKQNVIRISLCTRARANSGKSIGASARCTRRVPAPDVPWWSSRLEEAFTCIISDRSRATRCPLQTPIRRRLSHTFRTHLMTAYTQTAGRLTARGRTWWLQHSPSTGMQ